jgi:hypothetical protein
MAALHTAQFPESEYRAKAWEYLSLAENMKRSRATRRYAPVRENVDEPFGTDG